MMYGYWELVATVVMSLMIAGCSTVSDTPDDDMIEVGPGYSAAEAYEAAAPWLPVDTQVVVAATSSSIWELLGDDLLAIAPEDSGAGEVGTKSGLRVDLEDHVYEHFGFDPGLAEGVVVGVSEESMALVVFGAFQDIEHDGEIEVAGRQAFEIGVPEVVSYGLMRNSRVGDATAVVMAVDKPRQGLVVAANRDQLKEMIEAENGNAMPGDEERGALYSGLFNEVGDASMAVAITSGELGTMLGVGPGMPIPETAVIGYHGDMSVSFSGDDQVLSELQEMVAMGIGQLKETTQENYQQIGLGFEERALAIYSHHIVEALSRQMVPEMSNGRLRYDLEVTGSEIGLLMNYAIVQGAFLFVGARDDAKIRTAQIEANQLRQIVEAYYMTTSPNSLPDSLDDLTRGDRPLTAEIPLDPWGNEYIYRPLSNNDFEVFSAGPDGIEGTADDVYPDW